jgi:hypothetical protein
VVAAPTTAARPPAVTDALRDLLREVGRCRVRGGPAWSGAPWKGGLLAVAMRHRRESSYRLCKPGRVMRFACVDGPEFDGHGVDFDELSDRLTTYRVPEQAAASHDCRGSA